MGSWSASYVTGVPLMDTQHQELFRHMDDLVDKTKVNQIPEILDYLGKYVDKHFREEQNLHASCGYPQREEHKKLHAEFVASYKQLKEDFAKSPGKAGIMSLRISRTAVEWLKNHIYGPDRMFAKYYFSLPGHVQPKEANLGPNTGAPRAAASPSGTHPESAETAKPRTLSRFSASSPESAGAENVCEADWEVIKRLPARVLANELARRAEMADTPAMKARPPRA